MKYYVGQTLRRVVFDEEEEDRAYRIQIKRIDDGDYPYKAVCLADSYGLVKVGDDLHFPADTLKMYYLPEEMMENE